MMTNLLLDITSATIDWSRAQFALTAIYHWLFVPLTLGLAVIMGIAETCYYRTNKPFWKHVTRFWQNSLASTSPWVLPRESSWSLNSEPTGATTPGSWATYSALP